MKEEQVDKHHPHRTIEASIPSPIKTPGLNMMALYNKRLKRTQQSWAA
jgi:hypothetical protein